MWGILSVVSGMVPGYMPGLFTNEGYLALNGTSSVTLAAPLNNTAAGVIDADTAAGPLTLADTSGTSILNGKIGLNNDSLTISGTYTTTGTLAEEFSADDSTTLTGTLTLASGASADFDHLILTAPSGGGSGGLLTGAGDLSINGDGVDNGGYLKLLSGTLGGSGNATIGAYATLDLSGSGTVGRNLDVQGAVEWTTPPPTTPTVTFAMGTSVHVEKGGLFDYEDGGGFGGGSVPTLNNDGTLEVGAGDRLGLGTLTQSSTGTLQSNLASAGSYGLVSVMGTATLDGTLDGNLENSYQPTPGTSFDVLNFASSSGQFATVEPQGWSAQYNPTSVDLVEG